MRPRDGEKQRAKFKWDAWPRPRTQPSELNVDCASSGCGLAQPRRIARCVGHERERCMGHEWERCIGHVSGDAAVAQALTPATASSAW